MEKIVSVNEVKKTYGKGNQKKTQALKGISFEVEKGEFVGIMGASGSGKSTLLNLLATLDNTGIGLSANNETSRKQGIADFLFN